MSEEQVIMRYYQSLFGVPRRYEKTKLTAFLQDDSGAIAGWETQTVKPDFAMDSKVLREELESRGDMMERLGGLKVKRFAPNFPSMVYSYLDGLEINDSTS
jgi:hypothetical protein